MIWSNDKIQGKQETPKPWEIVNPRNVYFDSKECKEYFEYLMSQISEFFGVPKSLLIKPGIRE